MASGSKTAIYVGIAATLAIAATKFVAGDVANSSAMIAEGVHSLVDTSDALLLLLGLHRSRRPPDEDHPFGHGKELYFWSLIVAILFFAIGGGMSVYDGIHHIRFPEALRELSWSYAVLGAGILFTIGSLIVSVRAFRRTQGDRGFWEAIHRGKDPTLFTLILEDVADIVGMAIAFVGLFLARRLGSPMLDGVASIAVGVLLAGVACVLANESMGLLVGEGAEPKVRARIRSIAERDRAVLAVHRPLTMYFGPQVVLVALGIEFDPRLTSAEVAEAIDRIERSIRDALPNVDYLYISAESITRKPEVDAAAAAQPTVSATEGTG